MILHYAVKKDTEQSIDSSTHVTDATVHLVDLTDAGEAMDASLAPIAATVQQGADDVSFVTMEQSIDSSTHATDATVHLVDLTDAGETVVLINVEETTISVVNINKDAIIDSCVHAIEDNDSTTEILRECTISPLDFANDADIFSCTHTNVVEAIPADLTKNADTASAGDMGMCDIVDSAFATIEDNHDKNTASLSTSSPNSSYYKFYNDRGTQLLPILTPLFKGCSSAYALIVLQDDNGREVTLSTGTIIKLSNGKVKRVFIAGLEFAGVSPYQYRAPLVSLSLLLVSMESWNNFKNQSIVIYIDIDF